jgi:hypothetical protein
MKVITGAVIAAALALTSLSVSARLIRFGDEPNVNPTICSSFVDGSGAMVGCLDWGHINQAYDDTAAEDLTYIDMQAGTPTSLLYWHDGYNELQNVLFANTNGDGDSWARIEINPLQGQGVTVHSFDIGAWLHTQRISDFVRVVDLITGAELFRVGPVLIGVGDHSNHFAPEVFSQNGLAIEWRASAYNNGIDNICFNGPCVDEFSVPAPSAAALLALGLLVLVPPLKRRRR